MFQTIAAYKESLDQGYLDTDVKGVITLTSGQQIEFGEKDIVPGSLTYDNKALNGNDFAFGGIYVGELSVDLMLTMNRFTLPGAQITIRYYAKVPSGEQQEIPIGIFYVYEVNRTKKIISLKAYDAMIKFDLTIQEGISGYFFEVLSFISTKCGVQLGQTEEEIRGFINADKWLHLDPELITTYRGALAQIGILSGRFATIDRSGKLVFRSFQTGVVQDQISPRRRTESMIQDYRTFFCGVKARFLANTNYYPYLAVDETIENGIVLDLGDMNLFIGEDNTKKEILESLLSLLVSINYVPTDFTTISDPSIDLGDCVELLAVNATSESVRTIVHSFSWSYHGTQKIISYGMDPHISGVVSKDEKLIAQIENQLSSKDVIVKSYTNSNEILVDQVKEKEVTQMNFAAVKDTIVLFMMTVPFLASMDGVLCVRYYLNGVLEENAIVRKYFDKGYGYISLVNYFPLLESGRVSLRITMQMEGYESNDRIQEANILSILDYVKNQEVVITDEGKPVLSKAYVQQQPDQTVASILIRASAIKAAIFAQGLASAGQWDGTILIADKLGVQKFKTEFFVLSQMGEELSINKAVPLSYSLTDGMELLFAGGVEYQVQKMEGQTRIERVEVPIIPATEILNSVRLDLFFTLDQIHESVEMSTIEQE